MSMRSGQATPTEQRKLQPHKSRGKSLIPIKAKRVRKVQLFPLRWLPKNPPHSKPTASSSSITLTVIPPGTGSGSESKWVVLSDPTAPSKPNVVAQTSTDQTDYRFPLLIADE